LDTQRYEGKPLVRLLELYVLWATDTLSDEVEAKLYAMAPKLWETFGGDGSWQSAISTAMEFPPDMPGLIVENWKRNCAIAAANRAELLPQKFAETFVDANFAPDSAPPLDGDG
jgi:hypothetical protein